MARNTLPTQAAKYGVVHGPYGLTWALSLLICLRDSLSYAVNIRYSFSGLRLQENRLESWWKCWEKIRRTNRLIFQQCGTNFGNRGTWLSLANWFMLHVTNAGYHGCIRSLTSTPLPWNRFWIGQEQVDVIRSDRETDGAYDFLTVTTLSSIHSRFQRFAP